jgi:methionyl-tRNA synthetase
MTKAPLFVSTAISYPNGVPHIGHAYELIGADVFARFARLDGQDVFFMTGTDEHGLKMLQTAQKEGLDVRALADRNSARFQAMVGALGASPDRFIRTTEPAHRESVQALWQAMEAKGDIYLDRYEGWYSVRDEAYFGDDELTTDAETGEKRAPSGAPVTWTVEESYFFRLSAYADKLLELYQANPDFIQPDGRRNEIISFVKGGLKDLSISRTSFDWGVPVPGAPGHVMYVWVDALTNYITGVGYPNAWEGAFARYWQQSGAAQRRVIHIIGKDIVRFHAVYWPAFLLSAGVPLPSQVFGHGFLTVRGEKMSKSVGNVVDPFQLAERYGADPLRYVLMRDVAWGSDGSYSDDAIVTRANADLANSFGNLAQRTLSFIAKNLEGKLPALPEQLAGDDAALLTTVRDELTEAADKMRAMALSAGLEAWLRAVFACNAYIDKQAPWALRKTDPERMAAVLATVVTAIGQLAVLLSPATPAACAKLLDHLGVPEAVRTTSIIGARAWYDALIAQGFTIGVPSPIFPRLELPADAD